MEFGGVTIDRDQHSATHEGTELGLTPKEFELLAVLAEELGRVVPELSSTPESGTRCGSAAANHSTFT